MAASSAAVRFRNAYGDRKPPDITRRITACVACRKLKIKCHMTNSKPPCTRCKSRGLPCTVNKSIQMILEDDLTWKDSMEKRVKALEQLLVATNGVSNPDSQERQSPSHLSRNSQRSSWDFEPTSQNAIDLPESPSVPEIRSSTTGLNFSCSPGAFPASSLTCHPINDRGEISKNNPDLITKGCLPESVARDLLEYYRVHLDRHVYNILQDSSLDDLRRRSSMLTASVMTVAAFCSGSEHHAPCLKAFTDEVTGELFSKDHNFDEIRALCIGSLWLQDVSATLCGLAVRFGSELNLHRCITKMPHTDPKCYERTQLYFLVVVCDHHCSLRYGRPPMSQSLSSLKHPRTLLQSSISPVSDGKLICHLELWSINHQVFNLFGADVTSDFNSAKAIEIEKFSGYLDDWRKLWNDALARNRQLDQFTTQNLDIYYYSAKLCLCALIFRGPNVDPFIVGSDTARLAHYAVENAVLLMKSVTTAEQEVSKLPAYFITMIAFAAVFLLRIQSYSQSNFSVDQEEVLGPLRHLSDILTQCNTHPDHPLTVIRKGLITAFSAQSDPSSLSQQIPSSLLDFDFQLLPEDFLGLASSQNIDWNDFSTFETGVPESCDTDFGNLG
ncbi:unnamed protein product [Periconia digitata]|uniref:Zn(2)-C6 fungal-type domain-containing protein n=1 Tax=Periconia digitata TaxID=1303443 RepID=A0A9W4XHA2_9PLEO|nr:unnamed protein product [Periconia digitata]